MKKTTFFTEIKNNPMFKNIGALAFLAILLVGIVVAMLALNISQELRQQAAIDKTVPVVYLAETPTSFPLNQKVTLPLYASVPQGKNITGMQAWVSFSGTLPADLTFKSAKIGDLDSINRWSTEGQTKVLSVAHVTNATDEFITTGQPLLLGEFEFTPTAAGNLTATFHNTFTKIEERGSSTNLVQSFPVQTYQLAQSGGGTPTPTLGTPTPTPSAGVSTPTPTPTPTIQATNSPTPSPTGVGLACNATCQNDRDCQTGYCYQPPMPTCSPGLACPQVMPAKVCRHQTNPTSTTCTPIASTPTPTPTGSANVCTSISFQTPDGQSKVKVGDNLSFTCGQIAGLQYYQFRVIRPDQSIVDLPSVSAQSRTSAPYTVQVKGPHVVQCRACQNSDTGGQLSGCMNWENVPGM